MKATAASRRTRSPTRPPARCEAVNWNAPALNTVLLPLQRGRGPLHPHLRPPVLADVAVGPRRRRPDERPADRHLIAYLQTIQLPPEECARRRQRLRGRHLPSRSRTRSRRPSTPRGRRRAPRATARPLFNLQASSGAYSLRPLPHPRVVATATRVVSGGGAMGPNLTGGAEVTAVPERGRPDRVRPDRLRAGQEVRPAGPGHGPHAGLRPDAHRHEQIQAIVEYERSL